ncbi:MAG TPA: LytR C-terminal domain-containing protein [Pseudolysinimonas sp.]
MATFPQDQFDEVPAELKRVGAHRAPRPRGRGAINFAWAALATGILVVGGLYGLSRVNPDISFTLPDFGGGTEGPGATPTPSASSVAPVTDPSTVDPKLKLSISVLNGSSVDGLDDVAGDVIKAAKWPNPARNPSTSRDLATTVIYYRTTDFEGIALGLQQLLGGVGKIQLSDRYLGAPITIVVGEDYATIAGSGG